MSTAGCADGGFSERGEQVDDHDVAGVWSDIVGSFCGEVEEQNLQALPWGRVVSDASERGWLVVK